MSDDVPSLDYHLCDPGGLEIGVWTEPKDLTPEELEHIGKWIVEWTRTHPPMTIICTIVASESRGDTITLMPVRGEDDLRRPGLYKNFKPPGDPP